VTFRRKKHGEKINNLREEKEDFRRSLAAEDGRKEKLR